MKKKGHTVVHTIEPGIDLIFLQDPRYSELGISINEIVAYKHLNPATKIIHRVNECDARKGTKDVDDLLRTCSSYTDLTVFVSGWMKNYHKNLGWNCPKNTFVHNGVNSKHFYPCPVGKKIKNGKINVVAHHWSNNRMKGFDIYEAMDRLVASDSRFTFTYIGRDLGTFDNTTLVPPTHGKDLGELLSTFDVYISGTLNDPGPNHILESISCGLPTYVLNKGGGAVEFAGIEHSFQDFDELVSILSGKLELNSYKPSSWEKCMEKYHELIEGL